MFKEIELTTQDSIWTRSKNNREATIAKHTHEGWAEYVAAFCDSNPADQIAPGVFVTWTHNFEHSYLNAKEFEPFCERTLAAKDGLEPLARILQNDGLNSSYGVCDSPEQFLASKVFKFYNDRPEEFIASLTEVNKEQDSGWRWHKWGPYIGTHKKQCEYLRDEEDIDRVYCYHILLRNNAINAT